MKINLVILILLFSIFPSCANEWNEKLIGVWTIDEAEYEDKDVKLDLLINMIEFKKKRELLLAINNSSKQSG